MSVIYQQVRAARRRLNAQVLCDAFARAACGAAVAMLVVILVERRIWPGPWANWALSACLAGGLAYVGAYVWSRRWHTADASVAIDEAANLRARLSTALAVANEPNPFSRAVVLDAEQAAQRVRVPQLFPLRWPRYANWAIGLLAVLFAATFVPEAPPPVNSSPGAGSSPPIAADLQQEVAELRSIAQDDARLEQLAAELEKIAAEQAESPEAARQEIVKRVDQVAAEMERSLESASQRAAVQERLLSQLRGEKSESDPLREALAQGDFGAAREKLDQLGELASQQSSAEQGSSSATSKPSQDAASASQPSSDDALARGAAELAELATDMSRANDALRLAKELEHKLKLSPELAQAMLEKLSQIDPAAIPKELAEQLGDMRVPPELMESIARQLAEHVSASQSMQELSKCFAQAAESMQSSEKDAEQLRAQLEAAKEMLDKMQGAQAAAQSLALQMSQLGQLRQCAAGQRPASGLQPGVGSGSASPEVAMDKRPAALERVRVAHGEDGPMIGQMLLDEPVTADPSRAKAREAMTAAVHAASEAIGREETSVQYQQVLRTYFDGLAGLLASDKSAESTATE